MPIALHFVWIVNASRHEHDPLESQINLSTCKHYWYQHAFLHPQALGPQHDSRVFCASNNVNQTHKATLSLACAMTTLSQFPTGSTQIEILSSSVQVDV